MGSQVCPFCQGPETDRIEIDGRRFLVFGCLFTPEVDPTMDETRLAEHLNAAYRRGDPAFFRGMCDRLHLYVTKGTGARELTAPPTRAASP
ncbi:MAG: hypothetical protein L3K08_00295 [Thermoplasmata archaeon]|nr:hypothetical protein [Thermoplasmata archaeon]